jgi:hypothetical protein
MLDVKVFNAFYAVMFTLWQFLTSNDGSVTMWDCNDALHSNPSSNTSQYFFEPCFLDYTTFRHIPYRAKYR